MHWTGRFHFPDVSRIFTPILRENEAAVFYKTENILFLPECLQFSRVLLTSREREGKQTEKGRRGERHRHEGELEKISRTFFQSPQLLRPAGVDVVGQAALSRAGPLKGRGESSRVERREFRESRGGGL